MYKLNIFVYFLKYNNIFNKQMRFGIYFSSSGKPFPLTILCSLLHFITNRKGLLCRIMTLNVIKKITLKKKWATLKKLWNQENEGREAVSNAHLVFLKHIEANSLYVKQAAFSGRIDCPDKWRRLALTWSCFHFFPTGANSTFKLVSFKATFVS